MPVEHLYIQAVWTVAMTSNIIFNGLIQVTSMYKSNLSIHELHGHITVKRMVIVFT